MEKALQVRCQSPEHKFSIVSFLFNEICCGTNFCDSKVLPEHRRGLLPVFIELCGAVILMISLTTG